jgi:hypothetical protein
MQGGRRLAAAAVLGLAAAAGLAVVAVASAFWWALPRPIASRPFECAALAAVAVLAVLGRRGAGVDRLATRALAGPAAIVVAAGLVALVAAWAPSYLARPWFRDADAFASLALGWDRGVRPYRDVVAYNFPGETYLHWALGRLFGWGRTWPLHAADLALFAVLCGAAVAWSRRRLGGAMPGLAAAAAWTWMYLSYNFMMIPERDWQAAALAAIGLMAADGWGGPRGAAACGAATAAALSLRPHAVLMFPAIGAALAGGLGARWDARRWAASAGVFAASCAATGVLLLMPVLAAGLVPDWLRGLRLTAYGGPYGRGRSAPDLVGRMIEGMSSVWTGWLLAGCLGYGLIGPAGRRSAGWWTGLALAGALAWRGVHPVDHPYLTLPRDLFGGLAVAVPAAVVLGAERLGAASRLVLLALVMRQAMPGWPRTLDPAASADAAWALARGDEPTRTPPGCGAGFGAEGGSETRYRWDDYRDVLEYLRHETVPGAPVANLLRRFPFPAINGPAGRLDPFRAESGICWMLLVDQDLDVEFARRLREAGEDTVVVWAPDEVPHPRLRLPVTTAVVRSDFELAARFGEIEAWRRRRPPG